MIALDDFCQKSLDEIRADLIEVHKIDGFSVEAFPGFDINNDEHLIQSMIGTTSRLLKLRLESAWHEEARSRVDSIMERVRDEWSASRGR